MLDARVIYANKIRDALDCFYCKVLLLFISIYVEVCNLSCLYQMERSIAEELYSDTLKKMSQIELDAESCGTSI